MWQVPRASVLEGAVSAASRPRLRPLIRLLGGNPCAQSCGGKAACVHISEDVYLIMHLFGLDRYLIGVPKGGSLWVSQCHVSFVFCSLLFSCCVFQSSSGERPMPYRAGWLIGFGGGGRMADLSQAFVLESRRHRSFRKHLGWRLVASSAALWSS